METEQLVIPPFITIISTTSPMTAKLLLPLHHEQHQLPLPHTVFEDQPATISSASRKNKLAWLHDQVIGDGIEFDSPFGKRRVTYADTTATGRCLKLIEDYIVTNVIPFYGNTHTCDSFVGQETSKMVRQATQYIKTCLGATTQNDAVVFCGSGTTAAIKRLQEVMGVAVPSPLRHRILNLINDEERWVVFTGPHEHHSNCLSWRQSLAEVVQIGLDPENGLAVDMAALQAKLELYRPTKRPMMGSFSACSNVTGVCSDTRAIARLLHRYGAFACFDFAASGPYVEIKMRSGEMDGYDAVFLSPHKFLGGPGSPGILVMNKALYKLGSSPPSTCGGGTVNFVNGYSEEDTLYVDDIEEREDAGTPPITQKIRAALAFWVKEYIGYRVIETQEKYYIHRAMNRLLPNPNIWVLGTTADPNNNTTTTSTINRQAILSFLVYSSIDPSLPVPVPMPVPLPSSDASNRAEGSSDAELINLWGENSTTGKRSKPLHGPFIAKLLNDLFGIQARGGCACAGPYAHALLGIDHHHSLALKSYVQKGYLGVKPGWVRVSFPYYMSDQEFEFILLAIDFVAAFGQRFLPLYQYGWTTGNWSFDEEALEKILAAAGTHHDDDNDVDDQNCFFSSLKLGRRPVSSTASVEEKHQYASDHVDLKKIQTFVSYLSCARRLASLLPRFPPHRMVPKEIDPNHLLFRL